MWESRHVIVRLPFIMFCYWILILFPKITLSAETIPSFFSSNIVSLDKGFFASQLYLSEIKDYQEFEIVQISFNEYRNWEELRIKGKVFALSEKSWELTPNFCTIYTQKEIEKRWTLLLTFDCDHLKYVLKIGPKGNAILTPGIQLDTNLILQPYKQSSSDGYFFQVIKRENDKVFVWGKNARYVRKNSISSKWENNQIGTNKYKVVTPIDTMMIVSDPALELKEGDILFVPKNSKESLFP